VGCFSWPAGSQLVAAARAAGLAPCVEAFADRAYAADGSLVSRAVAGSVLHDAQVVVGRALRLAIDRTVVAVDGSLLQIVADTICIHSDTPGAASLAAAVRRALEDAGVPCARRGRA